MAQFNNILLVAARKPAAQIVLRRSMKLIRAADAVVTLAAPLNWPQDEPATPDPTFSPDEMREILIERHTEELREAIDEVVPDYTNITIKVLVGRPYVEVIREAMRSGSDLIVKTAEGSGATARLFGSHDMHLIRKCPCPVMIIKPSRRQSFRHILAAIDVTDEEGLGLNEKILDAAIRIARTEQSKLSVVNAWSYFAEDFLRSKRGYYEEMDKFLSEMREQHQQAADSLLGQFDTAGLACESVLLKGDPEDVIPEFTRENKVDLIVIGTLGRVGIPGMLIGNTAETILYRTGCSVLTLKPDGFVSPVTLD